MQALELFISNNNEFYTQPSVVTEINAKSDEISWVLTPLLASEKLIIQSASLTSLFNQLNMNFGSGNFSYQLSVPLAVCTAFLRKVRG
ncbi:hypothetical protein [Okeania sp.]|uniref:hypothetical protein n=1 Tax=Okeania sp. TaxID=3100323 RepID=UPI002B4B8A52|nr:hypothetical protein [Okeania sp.]